MIIRRFYIHYKHNLIKIDIQNGCIGDVFMEILGKRLKWLRNKERYSQKELADMIGMTPSGYQKIENDERDPKLDVLVKLCDIFNVSADFMLGRENNIRYLDKLHEKIIETEQRLAENNVRNHEHLKYIDSLRVQMIEAAKELGLADKVTIQLSESLDRNLERYTAMQSTLLEVERDRYELFKEYLSQFLDIPDAIGKEDPLLYKYIPYTAHIQPDIFDEYSIHIHGEGFGGFGHYGNFKTVEEAEGYKDIVLRKLNG